MAYYESLSAAQKAPLWNAWELLILKAVFIQANVNVAMRVTDDYAALALAPADKGQFDFWIRLSTLDKGLPVYLPVKLAAYHRQALAGLKPNSSLTLNRRKGKWSLTLSVDVPVPDIEAEDQPRGTAGSDVGFATTSWIVVATASAGWMSASPSRSSVHKRKLAARLNSALA